MGAARSWTMMAFGGPLLTALVALSFSSPARVFLHDVVTCQWRVSSTAQAMIIMVPVVLSLAITLTFVTAAVQQPNVPWWTRAFWALSLLLASPLIVPIYWFLYLRRLQG